MIDDVAKESRIPGQRQLGSICEIESDCLIFLKIDWHRSNLSKNDINFEMYCLIFRKKQILKSNLSKLIRLEKTELLFKKFGQIKILIVI